MVTCPKWHIPGRTERETWFPFLYPTSVWPSLLPLHHHNFNLPLEVLNSGHPQCRAAALSPPLVSAFTLATFSLVKLASRVPWRQPTEGPAVSLSLGDAGGSPYQICARVSMSARTVMWMPASLGWFMIQESRIPHHKDVGLPAGCDLERNCRGLGSWCYCLQQFGTVTSSVTKCLSSAFLKGRPFRIGWLESFLTFSLEGRLHGCLWVMGMTWLLSIVRADEGQETFSVISPGLSGSLVSWHVLPHLILTRTLWGLHFEDKDIVAQRN